MIFRLAELLLILVPLAGAIYAAFKGVSAINRRQGQSPPEVEASPVVHSEAKSQAAHWRTITRLLDQHSRTDSRWLDYELDAAKLLDFPVMTDMREPLTVAFHRAKLRADLLRPAKAEELLDECRETVAAQVMKALEKGETDVESLQRVVRKTAGKLVSDRTKRRPMIVPVVMAV